MISPPLLLACSAILAFAHRRSDQSLLVPLLIKTSDPNPRGDAPDGMRGSFLRLRDMELYKPRKCCIITWLVFIY